MSNPSDRTPQGIAGGLTKAFIHSALTPLMILAALAVGLVALVSLPREEEPQISVPLVDIHIRAPGLRAEDAVKLVTEPMESIVQGLNGVEHVYSQTRALYYSSVFNQLVGDFKTASEMADRAIESARLLGLTMVEAAARILSISAQSCAFSSPAASRAIISTTCLPVRIRQSGLALRL